MENIIDLLAQAEKLLAEAEAEMQKELPGFEVRFGKLLADHDQFKRTLLVRKLELMRLFANVVSLLGVEKVRLMQHCPGFPGQFSRLNQPGLYDAQVQFVSSEEVVPLYPSDFGPRCKGGPQSPEQFLTTTHGTRFESLGIGVLQLLKERLTEIRADHSHYQAVRELCTQIASSVDEPKQKEVFKKKH